MSVHKDCRVLADHAAVGRLIETLAASVAARAAGAPIVLVGIPRRGVALAQRLGALLTRDGHACTVESVDPTLWRDDFDAAARQIKIGGSLGPAAVEGRHVVLVDDVIMTGRTARAALDHIMLLGRPTRVELAALVDRAGREVPIQPDHVALRESFGPDRKVELELVPVDQLDRLMLCAAHDGAEGESGVADPFPGDAAAGSTRHQSHG